jgi:predicted kinase
MKFIKEYNQFILEEVSKNEPIPEIIGVDRGLAIFVIGQPAIGKSFFIKNYIHTKNPNIKDFSTDDVSLLFTKDPNVYYRGKELPDGSRTKNASELNMQKMSNFIETGQNFIYDTTGAGKEFTDRGFEHVKEIFDSAKSNGYKIIFIHLLSTLQTSLDQDKLRSRHVEPNYIKWAYAKQQGGEIDGVKVEGNISRYKSLNPDSYYLVTSIDKKYKFYKFINGKLAVRKNDKYIIKESINNEKLIDDIVETMLDFTDDDYKVRFDSSRGGINYQQYLSGDIDEFQPTFRFGNIIKSMFTITIMSNQKFKTYEDLVRICDQMQVPIARISDMGWKFNSLDIKSYKTDHEEPNFSYIEYKFTKPDEKISDDKKFDINEFGQSFKKLTELDIKNIEYDDSNKSTIMLTVHFGINTYDGELPREIEDRLDKVADLYGADNWDWFKSRQYVVYYWDSK